MIADHPGIAEVAVFGIPHGRWGETPMAVCRLQRKVLREPHWAGHERRVGGG